MRILQIQLQNLNALAGRWSLDLSDAAYAQEGLFAITGPTGAGKSTLLDAICLALYGRTPRLGRVGRSGNDIMARHTGECFAEVTFATPAGRWRCHWSQRRAHRKPSGELQQPRHEIADADSGRVIASSLREVAVQVESITGMDFERFTRAMLLAQGGFAAFLLAEPDQRAPLLEQLTGTALYSEISMRVHERHRQEQQELQRLQSGLQVLQPMAEGEAKTLRDEAQRLRERTRAQTQNMADGDKALRWGERVLQLHAALDALEHAKRALDDEAAAFSPQNQQLQTAVRALELASAHSALHALRQAQQDEGAAEQQVLAQQNASAEAVQEAEAVAHRAQQDWQSARTALDEAQAPLRTVRALDVQWQEKQRALTTAAAEADKASEALQTAHTALEQARTEQDNARQALAETQAQQQAAVQQHPHIAALAEDWPRLHTQMQDLQELQKAAQQRQQRLQKAQDEAQRHAQKSAQSAQALQTLQAQAEQAQADWAQHNSALAGLMGEQTLPEWRQTLEQARQHAASWGEARATHQQWRDAHQAQSTANTLLQHARETLAQTQHRIALLDAQAQAQDNALAQLEHQKQLELRIQKLEDMRPALTPGEPCPLCGATEHPFADAHPAIAPDQTQAAIDAARTQREDTRQQHTQAQIDEAQLQTQTTQAEAEIQRQRKAGETAQSRLQSQLQALQSQAHSSTDPLAQRSTLNAQPQSPQPASLQPDLAWADWLQAQHQQHQQHAEQLGEHLAAIDAATTELQRLQTLADKARHDLHSAEAQARDDNRQHEQAQARIAALQEAAQSPDAHLAQRSQTLHALLQPHLAQAEQDLPALEPLMAELAQRSAHWHNLQEQLGAQQKQCEQHANRIALLEQDQRRSQSQAEAASAHLAQLQKEAQTLAAQRDAALQPLCVHLAAPDIPPGADAIETALRDRLDRAEHTHQQAQQSLLTAQQNRHSLQQRLSALQQTMAERAGRLQAAEADFRTQLESRDFADEAAWQAAHLPESQRKALQQASIDLVRRQAEWLGQYMEVWSPLEKALKEDNPLQQALVKAEWEIAPFEDFFMDKPPPAPIAPEALPGLMQALPGLMQTLREHQSRRADEHTEAMQKLGAIEQRLRDDDAQHQRHTLQMQDIAAQERECARWALLYELIGSSDGKKYRNFVQGLGFDAVIAHANRQLRSMSDRYLLVRDATQPLALNVVDNDQGGEIRTVKNLSGGESFIVSLALALGLSHMASRNVRVDALFLDEGFGMLDEDTLDVALDALVQVQRSGKLIGVISHVQALKERIPTQIEVIPLGAGRSALRGPGVEGG